MDDTDERLERIERRLRTLVDERGGDDSDIGHVIHDEGVPLPQRRVLDFVGEGVAVRDDEDGQVSTQVIIPGGGEAQENDKGSMVHGADANAERPEGYASVEWVGSVEPLNATDGDTWIPSPWTP